MQTTHCQIPRLLTAGLPTLLRTEVVRPELTIRGKALLNQSDEMRVLLVGEGTVELFMRLHEVDVRHHRRSLGGGVEKTKIERDVAEILGERATAVGARPEVFDDEFGGGTVSRSSHLGKSNSDSIVNALSA
jgi:hypothetical protein